MGPGSILYTFCGPVNRVPAFTTVDANAAAPSFENKPNENIVITTLRPHALFSSWDPPGTRYADVHRTEVLP
jgi:hypothetical protein